MPIVKINDNSSVSKSEFMEIENLVGRILNKTLSQLEKENIFVFPELVKESEDITGKQMIIQEVNNNYRSSNVMGFLGCGDERLIIESRFSNGPDDYFFQYLLEKVLEFPNILDLNTDYHQNDRTFNLLLFLFPYYLKQAMRKGAFKTYTQRKFNDGNVKGTIDFGRHIQKNTPFVGTIAYSKREFSYDNYLMEMIRHTIEFIKKKFCGQRILRKVKDEISSVVSVTPNYKNYDCQKIIIENKKNPLRHAYYHEYRSLQRLCIMILQHDKLQTELGIHQIQGVLFDGAWLWEEYVNLIISSEFYHPMNKKGRGAQQLFSTDTGKVGLIYPDFLGKNNHNRVVADAKYKPIGNIGNKDYLQILAYMFRFGARKGLYLYPESHKNKSKTFNLNSGLSFENNVAARNDTQVVKLGFAIPQEVNSYKEFRQQMVESEAVFFSQITEEYNLNTSSDFDKNGMNTNNKEL
jgi:5-methylcytosine-specific restriction endonuclease McrBC regulatory subunit McrC